MSGLLRLPMLSAVLLALALPARAETLLQLLSGAMDQDMFAAEAALPGLCDRMESEARRYARAFTVGATWSDYRYEIIHDPVMRPEEVPLMTWLGGHVYDNRLSPEEAGQEARAACEAILTPHLGEAPEFDDEIALSPEMREMIQRAPDGICVRLGEDARLAALARESGEPWEAFRSTLLSLTGQHTEVAPLRVVIAREVYGSFSDVDAAQEAIYRLCAEVRAS